MNYLIAFLFITVSAAGLILVAYEAGRSDGSEEERRKIESRHRWLSRN